MTTLITSDIILDTVRDKQPVTHRELAKILSDQRKITISHQDINKSQKSSQSEHFDSSYPGIFKINGLKQDEEHCWSCDDATTPTTTGNSGDHSPLPPSQP